MPKVKILIRSEGIYIATPGAPESDELEIIGFMVDDYRLSTITIGTFYIIAMQNEIIHRICFNYRNNQLLH